MRRVTGILLVIVGLFTAITGIWNFFPPFSSSFSPGHAVGACVFGVLAVIHVYLNWKAILRYFRGLGWWWLPVAASLIAIVVIVIVPIIRN